MVPIVVSTGKSTSVIIVPVTHYCNDRAGDSSLGQCVRVDFTKLGHEAVKVDEVRFRMLSSGCHDDLDVFVRYKGTNRWKQIYNNMDGHQPNGFTIPGSKFEKEVKHLDFCTDHGDCNHVMDWVVADVDYSSAKSPAPRGWTVKENNIGAIGRAPVFTQMVSQDLVEEPETVQEEPEPVESGTGSILHRKNLPRFLSLLTSRRRGG
jgi:hypothetical protein